MEQEKQYIPSQEELEQLMRDAEQGDAEAQYTLAICFLNGFGVEKDLEKHIYWLRLSAEQGWSHAIFRMCLNYAWGTGVEKDIEKAKYWYFKGEKYTEEVLREKAENGDIKCQGIMARLCGILQDDEGELYWIKRSADQGDRHAIYLLSDRYFHKGDYEESKRLMLILAKQSKSSDVFYECGRAHERTGDFEGAIYWYKRVIRKGDSNVEVAKIALKRMEKKLNQLKLQAEQGGIEAQCELAYYYKKEERDYGRALTWYLKAAEAGHSLAQCRVGRIYFDERNYEQAVYWLSKSAEQGDAVAQCELANCYENGYGVEKDLEKHIYWLRLSAEQENVNAMWRMFLSYARGIGVEKDVENAKYWFFKCSKLSEQSAVEKAENGDASWQYDLGILFYRMEDWNTAVYWYKKVVEQEYEFKNCALWAISSCYWLMNNWEEAKSWAIAAAEWTKTSNDQYECARLHEEAGDMDTAALWYQKAAENGSARAKLKISDLNNKIR